MSSCKHMVILLGAKLIGIDCALPFAMQIKAEQPEVMVHFVFLSEKDMPTVRQNYVLWNGLLAVGQVSALSPGRPGLAARVLTAWRLLLLLGAMVCRPTVLLTYSDLARFPLRWMAMACRVGKGVAVVHAKAIYPFSKELREEQEKKTAGKDVAFQDSGDRFVLWHPGQVADYSPFSRAPATILGTPRAYPSWLEYLAGIEARDGMQDDLGQRVTIAPGQPVMAIFYTGWVTIPSLVIPAEQQFRLFFEAVRQECPQAKLLIKPHPICHQEKLKEQLSDFPDLDIAVTYAHPQIVLGRATLSVFGNGSSVLDDVYAAGMTALEIAVYHPGFEQTGLFDNPGRVSAVTQDEMRAALRRWIDHPQTLPLPARDHLLCAKPTNLMQALVDGPQAI